MKNYLLGLLLILSTTTSFGKEKFGVDFGAGVKAGLNFNKVVASEWKNNYTTDPLAGLFVFVNKYRLGLQVEALWSQNHMTTDTSFYGLYHQYCNQVTDSFKSRTFRFTTISIPILVNIKLSQFLWLQGGPQYSQNVGVIDKNNLLKSGENIIKSNNFNLVGGLWLQLGSRTSHLRLNGGLRYISGITNMSTFSTIAGKADWKNQMIQLHVGINY